MSSASMIFVVLFCIFEYFLASIIYWGIKSGGIKLITYKRDMIIVPLLFILPVKIIYCITYGLILVIEKYRSLPSLKYEKIIIKEKVKKQSGNLSIVEKDDTGRLSVI